MEIIIGLFAFMFGLFVGFQYAARQSGKVFHYMLEEFGVSEKQLLAKAEELGIDTSDYVPEEEPEESDTVELLVERVGDSYYAYRWETDEFITQADTPEELLAQLITILPKNTRVNIDIDRGGKYFENLA